MEGHYTFPDKPYHSIKMHSVKCAILTGFPLSGLNYHTYVGAKIAIITTPPRVTEVTQIIKAMMAYSKQVTAWRILALFT